MQVSKKPELKKKESKLIKSALYVFLVGIILYLGFWVFLNKDDSDINLSNNQTTNPEEQEKFEKQKEEVKTRLKSFSGEEFKRLYNEFAYPNTQYISENSVITGNQEVDLYIQKYAEDRGYKRRSAPVQDVFRTVDGGMKVQERAYQPWLDLKSTAEKDGINLYLTAAYRSQSDQRDIFLSRFNVRPGEYAQILNGSYDSRLNDVLTMTAIPGYSRHHNGYTIDVGCNNQRDLAFEFSVCFEWLSRNNYENAKKHGWIPSYPEEADMQGPEPESWEYVWVGSAVYE